MPDLNLITPLEAFLRDYVRCIGGESDPVEPQVYDLLLPDQTQWHESDGLLRVAFDPEALPEHPGSQFMTLGTPLMDRMLSDAQARGRYARAWLHGLNTQPHDLPRRARKAIDLEDKIDVRFQPPRLVGVTLALFWFTATYVSDQNEQDMFQVAIELRHGRPVRQLEALTDWPRLDAQPLESWPDGNLWPMIDAYELARQQVVRTVSATANQRRRELVQRQQRQSERMKRYYGDLLEEIELQAGKACDRHEDVTRFVARRRATEQERNLRLADLERKHALHVELALCNLLEIRLPKLLLEATIHWSKQPPTELTFTWDTLTEQLEPADCPACCRPTLALREAPRPQSGWTCPSCSPSAAMISTINRGTGRRA